MTWLSEWIKNGDTGTEVQDKLLKGTNKNGADCLEKWVFIDPSSDTC